MRYNMFVTAATLACGVLAVTPAAHAQARESGRMRTPVGVAQIGLEGGWTISNFVGNELDNDSNRNGGYGGLSFIVQPNTSPIGFQTGVLFVQRGAKSSFTSGGSGFPSTSGGLKLSYIEVPAMVRIGVPLSVIGAAPTIIGGASLGWRVACRAILESGNRTTSSNCDDALVTENLDTKRFDLGATVGIELPIKVGQRGLIVPTVRYVRGLTKISDVAGNDTKNSSVMIGLGLRFR
jgi:hypothetical protein